MTQWGKISKIANFSKITILKCYNHSRVFIFIFSKFTKLRTSNVQNYHSSNNSYFRTLQNYHIFKISMFQTWQHVNFQKLEFSQFTTLQTNRHFHFSKFTKWVICQNANLQPLETLSCFQKHKMFRFSKKNPSILSYFPN